MGTYTYYEILGVQNDCSNDAIKKAYRVLIKKYHPDKSQQNNTEQIQLINKAYSVLKDPVKRNTYDNEIKRTNKTKFVSFEDVVEEARQFYRDQQKNNKQSEIKTIDKIAPEKPIPPDEFSSKVDEMRTTRQKDDGVKQQFEHNDDVDKNESRVLNSSFNKLCRQREQDNILFLQNKGKQKIVDELDARIDNLNTMREQDDIECIPSKIKFNDNFDLKKFNDVVDKSVKEQEEQKCPDQFEPFNASSNEHYNFVNDPTIEENKTDINDVFENVQDTKKSKISPYNMCTNQQDFIVYESMQNGTTTTLDEQFCGILPSDVKITKCDKQLDKDKRELMSTDELIDDMIKQRGYETEKFRKSIQSKKS